MTDTTGRIGWSPDYKQPDTLFDPRTTTPATCPSCGTTAKNACEHEADIAAGIRDPYAPRPRGCLCAWDFQIPDDQPLPY